jgi:hypothetical protein
VTHMDLCKACSCVADRHRLDADPDPDSILKFSRQRYSLIEMDTDPDPDGQVWMPIRVRQNDTVHRLKFTVVVVHHALIIFFVYLRTPSHN